MLLTWRRPGREIRNTHQRSPTLLSSLISISQASCPGESSHLLRLTANACKGNVTIAMSGPTLFCYLIQIVIALILHAQQKNIQGCVASQRQYCGILLNLLFHHMF